MPMVLVPICFALASACFSCSACCCCSLPGPGPAPSPLVAACIRTGTQSLLSHSVSVVATCMCHHIRSLALACLLLLLAHPGTRPCSLPLGCSLHQDRHSASVAATSISQLILCCCMSVAAAGSSWVPALRPPLCLQPTKTACLFLIAFGAAW